MCITNGKNDVHRYCAHISLGKQVYHRCRKLGSAFVGGRTDWGIHGDSPAVSPPPPPPHLSERLLGAVSAVTWPLVIACLAAEYIRRPVSSLSSVSDAIAAVLCRTPSPLFCVGRHRSCSVSDAIALLFCVGRHRRCSVSDAIAAQFCVGRHRHRTTCH